MKDMTLSWGRKRDLILKYFLLSFCPRKHLADFSSHLIGQSCEKPMIKQWPGSGTVTIRIDLDKPQCAPQCKYLEENRDLSSSKKE